MNDEQKEMCEYIKLYFENDKTQSALMLSGDWGTGKSYFINNFLKPYLNNECNKNRCIVISLYGMNCIADISKDIYFKIRLNKLQNSNEASNVAMLSLNLIAKGITSGLNVDLNMEDASLISLYKSIDVKEKLLVFEDIERSDIPFEMFMGFVNNMVENNKAKILLVANENEIIEKYENNEKSKQDEGIEGINENNFRNRYFEIKEKTVNDTLYFHSDTKMAIRNIINEYDNIKNIYEVDEIIDDIVDIMLIRQNYNLRTFKFACQKISEILDKINCETELLEDDLFKKVILYGVINFSIKYKNSSNINWKENILIDYSLGIFEYPLFKFCYDYIVFHHIDISSVKAAFEALNQKRIYDKTNAKNDVDVDCLRLWYLQSDENVITAIRSIYERLNKSDQDIPFFEYGDLVIYLIIVYDILGDKIDINFEEIINVIINNLKGKGVKIGEDSIWNSYMPDDNELLYSRFLEIRQKMTNSMDDICYEFNYEEQCLKNWEQDIIEDPDKYIKNNRFIKTIDVDKFVDLYVSCNSGNMQLIREMLIKICNGNIFEKESLEWKNLEQIKQKLIANNCDLDIIQTKQCNWMIQHLNKLVGETNA